MTELTMDIERFMYGNVLKRVTQNFKTKGANFLRETGNNIVRAALTLSLPAIMVLSGSQFITVSQNVDAQIFDIEVPHSLSVKELRSSLTRARRYLHLTQNNVAQMAGVSLASVQKFEQGQIAPKEENAEKYTAFLGLEGLYRKAYGNKRYLVKAHLGTPLSIYGGMTAIEFAGSRPDGLLILLATEKRMHG